MHTMPAFADGMGYDVAARRRRGVVAGIALSLLLHGLLIFGYRSAVRPAPAPNQALTVWIQAPPPRIEDEAQKPDVLAPAPRAKPLPAKTRKPPVRAASQPAQTSPQAITLPAPPRDAAADLRPAEPAPRLDMDAARRTARAVADEPDPRRAPGTLAAQLDQHPLYEKPEETRLAREIGAAKRANCKDGVPGGLLAPLLLLMDKKDSGCKW